MSFLGAIAVDISQPAQAPTQTFTLLIAYVVFAAGIAAATWNNWWLDAKLAGPAHAVDIGLFTVLVLLTEGYTSPFFVFFVFVLLAAAIRWGWRETTLTAILLAILYLVAGLVAAKSSVGFQLYRYIVRTGHLVILSLIIIWFGIHQWRARFLSSAADLLADPTLDRSPLETGLSAAMTALHATRGIFLWLDESGGCKCVVSDPGEPTFATFNCGAAVAPTPRPFLYKVAKGRTLTRDSERNLVAGSTGDVIDGGLTAAFGPGEGLALPVRTGTGEGQLFLEGMPGLSTDHIDLGEQLAVDLVAHFQRHALLQAAAESAEASSRIALARDLHDSVVQFLAGAAFRLEAMKRSEASGRKLEPDLNELKQLMLQEQGELRAFVTALRSGSRVPFVDLANDLRTLTERLSRQWSIQCVFVADPTETLTVPSALNLDAHQLVREAVANAVRHAEAQSVRVTLGGTREAIHLEMINDGAAYPKHSDQVELPQSLRERVQQAGGALEISRGMDVTKLSISLPIADRGQ
ncbi:MAG TPA: histidine kinase [Sphingomicrobium sp.]|nr:histidine kinase [Sphingomicrobium sp.]